MTITVHDLKTIFEKEQALNVIRALLYSGKHWRNFKLIMTHNRDERLSKQSQNTLK